MNETKANKRKAICPLCKDKIEFLFNFRTGTYRSNITINAEGFCRTIGDEDFNWHGKEEQFYCPKCLEMIFENPKDAIACLKGGTNKTSE